MRLKNKKLLFSEKKFPCDFWLAHLFFVVSFSVNNNFFALFIDIFKKAFDWFEKGCAARKKSTGVGLTKKTTFCSLDLNRPWKEKNGGKNNYFCVTCNFLRKRRGVNAKRKSKGKKVGGHSFCKNCPTKKPIGPFKWGPFFFFFQPT